MKPGSCNCWASHVPTVRGDCPGWRLQSFCLPHASSPASRSMAIPRLLVFLASAVAVFGVDRLPIEDFSRTQDITRMVLSPDGGQAAYLADHNGITKLLVLDFGGKKTMRL